MGNYATSSIDDGDDAVSVSFLYSWKEVQGEE